MAKFDMNKFVKNKPVEDETEIVFYDKKKAKLKYEKRIKYKNKKEKDFDNWN